MAKFPMAPAYRDAGAYFDDYSLESQHARDSVHRDKINQAAARIEECIKNDRMIFVCGNGGSAAVANHLLCDYNKGIATDTALCPRIVSLCQFEIVSAYANDESYERTFWRQLERSSRPGDLLIALSVSGNSPNVVEAVWRFTSCIVMTGRNGGEVARRLIRLKDIHISVDSENYGVCEDTFQAIMHSIAQYIRQANMIEEKINTARF